MNEVKEYRLIDSFSGRLEEKIGVWEGLIRESELKHREKEQLFKAIRTWRTKRRVSITLISISINRSLADESNLLCYLEEAKKKIVNRRRESEEEMNIIWSLITEDLHDFKITGLAEVQSTFPEAFIS